mmetsp:Transcript_103235/g.205192  ORF Transcript_103235/g.205192 Transcript_103235/m.205192 type:complete len:316 (+) Transcript_103235:60-1007(+)
MLSECASTEGATHAAAMEDDELLAELQRRGYQVGRQQQQQPQGQQESAPATDRASIPLPSRNDTSSTTEGFGMEVSTVDVELLSETGPLELGRPGNALVPQLQSLDRQLNFGILADGVKRKCTWELVSGGSSDTGHGRLLFGSLSDNLGQLSMSMCNAQGSEVFKLVHATNVWNPSQVRWSFRVMPPGSDDSTDALFTINRDLLGSGKLGLREWWRVYRGLARNGDVAYYCAGWRSSWEYKFYKSEPDCKADRSPVAQLRQMEGTGQLSGESVLMSWLPARFELIVEPGEDSAVLLSVASILDMVHDRSKPQMPA